MAYWTGRNHHGVLGCVDIHAFGDSNLYLKRSRDRLILSSEHRVGSKN
jgi:hypothetical protein